MNIAVVSFSFNDYEGVSEIQKNTFNFIFDLKAVNDTAPSELTGLDMELISYFLNNKEMTTYVDSIVKILTLVLQETKVGDLNIAFGCPSGRRKSVFVSEYITRFINKTLQRMNNRDYKLTIKHLSTKDWIDKYSDKDKIKERIIFPV